MATQVTPKYYENVKVSNFLILGGPLMKYNTDSDIPYWYLAGITSYGIYFPSMFL
jgi:hypothetical protein